MILIFLIFVERSSTRLHAPPGGKTSISFGSYEPEVAKPRVVEQPVTIAPTPAPNSENFNHSGRFNANRGQSSIVFGESSVPTPVKYTKGTQSSISFGDYQESAVSKPQQRSTAAPLENITNDAPRRYRQAPGGNSSLVLG